jgi:two-component system invasion response regulator UvrY
MTGAALRGIRIFLVDDHPAVLEGLTLLLTRHGATVCGAASDCAAAEAGIDRLQPDLVLVDLSLVHENGLDLVAGLNTDRIKTLVYTMHDDARLIKAALDAGARGYVTKRELTDILQEAISRVLSGQTYISPVAQAALAAPDPLTDLWVAMEKLSPRERDIFLLAGDGLSAPEIAERFGVSISTVETHISRIIGKLDCAGTKEMRRLAIQHNTTLLKSL